MKLSTRDILLVTIIVAVGALWWVDHFAIIEARRERDNLRQANSKLKWQLDKLALALGPEFRVEFSDYGVSIVRTVADPLKWSSTSISRPSLTLPPSKLKTSTPKAFGGKSKRELTIGQ